MTRTDFAPAQLLFPVGRRTFFRGVVLLLIIASCLIAPLTSPAHGVEPVSHHQQIAAPLAGTLVLWGGGEVPEAAYRRFRELVGDHRIVIIAQETASKATAPWRQHRNEREEIILAGNDGALDERGARALSAARAVWVDLNPRHLRSLRDPLRRILAAGGVVGGYFAEFDLLPSVRQLTAPPELESPALEDELAEQPGLVGLLIPPETMAVVSGRRVNCFGGGPLVWRLPQPRLPGYPHRKLTITQQPGDEEDLVALNRAAAARRAIDFPGRAHRVPEVPHGTLLICGGGDLPEATWRRFVELAGGPQARIIFLPTATPNPDTTDLKGLEQLRKAGAPEVEVVRARTPAEVNSPEFATALKRATGIFFAGGRQWKYLDAYQGTVAEELFHDVLRRGGVIGGSSAGAAVQAEYMVRGSPFNNRIISAEGYEHGLAFLPGTAIDIHVAERDRLVQFRELIARRPNLLGIALDERAAIEVHGHELVAHGPGKVHLVTSHGGGDTHSVILPSGAQRDLRQRD